MSEVVEKKSSKKLKKAEYVPQKSSDVKELQKHLQLFGYLNPEDAAFGVEENRPPQPEESALESLKTSFIEPGKMDKATVEALKKYQEFHGLDVTGKLDRKTLDELDQKRCGMPDLGEFSTHGNKWSTTSLTYGFDNYTTDNGLTPAKIHEAIAQAFAMWAAETPLSFRRVNNSASADIRIKFVSGAHGDGSAFDGKGGVLAHAYYPPPNSGALAGDAHFDGAESWTINIPTGSGKVDLVTVAAHEFGHSLGLRHSNVNGSLMFPTYAGPMRYLHADDIAGIRTIYGGYSIENAPWIHGTSIQVEYPERLERITRAGFYTYLYGKPNTTNWFHFALPTPVIKDQKRLKVVCAILRFRTFSTKAMVDHVHIYDGYSKIAAHNNLSLSGDNWFKKFGVAHKPYVYWGLGISIGVSFSNGTLNERRMDFVSAGCDLIN
ncbi:DUF6623 family protein [Pseudozobellia thermophila]|uniref:Putative peptidoglycan binding domain-containing protein n=1 Tax=Pseudozobellia thermophila TaxID=192903 RepID=A0A1M6FJM6_9FLAO|nr:DUF6623 family protein [Pseudozobellia thermophila]SHI97819.1 Putative peptidoglycan binding domain-containing protein [Pseudozobellia thermophila]